MKLLKKLETLSSISVVACGLLLTGMSLFIALEVILRKFFSVSTKGADELSAYTFAVISAWSLAYTLLKKGHIRIDFLYARLPAPVQRFFDITAMLALGTFVSPMTYYTFKTLKTSVERLSRANTPLQTPLWIPQALWFAGILFFFTVVCVMTFMLLKMAVDRNFDGIAELGGCPLLDEEIEEESGIPVNPVKKPVEGS